MADWKGSRDPLPNAKEGDVWENTNTGERLVLERGIWVPLASREEWTGN